MSVANRSLPTLDYAKPIPLYRRRKLSLISAALLLGVALIASIRYRSSLQDAWNDLQVQYRWRQCKSYKPRAGEIDYSDDPAIAAGIQSNSTCLRVSSRPSGAIALQPKPLLALSRLYLPGNVHSLVSWTHCGVVYLGERTTSSGKKKLVVVYIDPDSDPGERGSEVSLWAAAIDRDQQYGAERSDLDFKNGFGAPWYSRPLEGSEGRPKPLTIFAGTSDSADPSKYSLILKVGEVQYQIHAQLVEESNGYIASHWTYETLH